jgi:hypothetical protein
MHEINYELNQLPFPVRTEVDAHAGHTDSMTPAQLVAHYRAIAQNLIEQKRARYLPLVPSDEMTSVITYMLHASENLSNLISGREHVPFPRWVTHEVIRFLQSFVNNLAPVQVRLEQEAHQRAMQAEQDAARLAAQRQAEEFEHRRAQEAARQLAQLQAEEAARLAAHLAASQLAQRQAEAVAQRDTEETALQATHLALEVKANQDQLQQRVPDKREAGSPHVPEQLPRAIALIPGPAAMAEIERAELVLKTSIETAVAHYAAAISPFLDSSGIVVSANY